MANLKSSKKDILVNARNHKRNLMFKSRMKTFVKKALVAIEQNLVDKEQFVKDALKNIDRTAAKGIIKRQVASRKKSRLMLYFNKQSVK